MDWMNVFEVLLGTFVGAVGAAVITLFIYLDQKKDSKKSEEFKRIYPLAYDCTKLVTEFNNHLIAFQRRTFIVHMQDFQGSKEKYSGKELESFTAELQGSLNNFRNNHLFLLSLVGEKDEKQFDMLEDFYVKVNDFIKEATYIKEYKDSNWFADESHKVLEKTNNFGSYYHKIIKEYR